MRKGRVRCNRKILVREVREYGEWLSRMATTTGRFSRREAEGYHDQEQLAARFQMERKEKLERISQRALCIGITEPVLGRLIKRVTGRHSGKEVCYGEE